MGGFDLMSVQGWCCIWSSKMARGGPLLSISQQGFGQENPDIWSILPPGGETHFWTGRTGSSWARPIDTRKTADTLIPVSFLGTFWAVQDTTGVIPEEQGISLPPGNLLSGL